MLPLLFLPVALCAADACVEVDAPRVLASHLAVSVPAFAALAPDTVLGYTPAPGLRRWWRGAQLRQIILRGAADPGPLQDLCVERPTRQVSETDLLAALRQVLPAGATLELLDFCHMPVPTGKLTFQLRDLGRPVTSSPDTRLLWRGRLVYDDTRSMPVWANVRIAVDQDGYFAARDIAQGKVIEAADIVRQTRRESIFAPLPAADAAALVGREARRLIGAGTALEISALSEPREVLAGEAVHVHVKSGTAQLAFDAKAATGGRRGESILVVNLQNQKRFKAIVDGRGSAVLDLESSNHESSANRTARPAPGGPGPGGQTVGQRREKDGPAVGARSPDPGS
jgi:flagella basal body P-ring formation protein FlgA